MGERKWVLELAAVVVVVAAAAVMTSLFVEEVELGPEVDAVVVVVVVAERLRLEDVAWLAVMM